MAVVPDVRMIGDAFANMYYDVLVRSPQLLYKFYKDYSILGRPDPSGKMLSVTTVEAINQLVMSMDYRASKVEIKTVDSQACYNNAVLVLVVGFITFNTSGARTFTQSFFLAPQEKGHFVLNDIVRYLDEEPQQQKQNLVEDADKANRVSQPVVNSEPVAEAQAQNGVIEQNLVEDAANANPVSEPVVNSEPVAQAQNGVIEQNIVEVAAKANPVSEPVVNCEPVAPAQAQSCGIEQSTTVADDTAPVVEELHDNDMQQREVPQGSAGQNGSAIEHAHNGGPPGPSQETPVVQEAPKMSYASILKNDAAQPTVALKKRPLVKTGAVQNSAQRPSTDSISAPPNSTSVNMTDRSTAEESGCSIFIDNLPLNITPAQVEQELKKFGVIKPSGVQVRSRPGRVSCFGFVQFKEAGSVQTAVRASPILIRGREVIVREKEARANKSLSSTPLNRTNDNNVEGTGCSVFIKNMPLNITHSQVEEEMKKFGAIKPSGVQVRNREGGLSSYAFVQFKEAVSVQTAIQASPILVEGRRVFIEEKKSNSAKRDYPYGGPGKGRSDFVNNRAGGGSGNGRCDFVNNKDGGGLGDGGGSSFAPSLEKESNGIIMATASVSGTQKRPHESDNSESYKEAPLASVVQDSSISLDHLALVAKDAEPISSSNWIDVPKKKGRKNHLRPT
jgi:RNA recognition motif-containing protein